MKNVVDKIKFNMDYHSMTLRELQEEARDHVPKIKRYYIKPRIELIRLLVMKELPQSYIIEKKKISELRKEARDKGYTNIWSLKRHQLIELLYPRSEQDNQNNQNADKHHYPK